MFLWRFISGRFVEATTFCQGNAFFFWISSSANFECWKVARGSRLSCLSSLPVSSKWASFEFALIDFLCFQLFPSERQRFYRLRTKTTQGVLGHWVSSLCYGRENSPWLISQERLTLPSSTSDFSWSVASKAFCQSRDVPDIFGLLVASSCRKFKNKINTAVLFINWAFFLIEKGQNFRYVSKLVLHNPLNGNVPKSEG